MITQTLCVQTHTHIQGCSAHFSSLMGYQYHQKRCGREFSDDEKPVFLCQHCGKTYRSKAGRDYHVRTEHSPTITSTMTATTTTNNNNKDNITDTNNNTGKERVRLSYLLYYRSYYRRQAFFCFLLFRRILLLDFTVISSQGLPTFSTQRRVLLLLQVVSEESPSFGKREQSQPERKDWQEKAPSGQPKEREREARDKDREKEKEKERERDKEKAAQNQSHGDDFERTPSGRVRRRSAQVAVFHLQEIAEDELAKDWGTKRRIKDDLVPDSKRVRTEGGCIRHTRSTFLADA